MVDLDIVFRSIINFRNKDGNLTIQQTDLLKNLKIFSQLMPQAPEEKAYSSLYSFISEFVRSCDIDEPELPSYEFLYEHFDKVEGNESVLAALDKIKTQKPYIGQEYRKLIGMYNNDQNLNRLEMVLSNVAKIASTGMEEGKGILKRKLHGILDGISYFATETKDLHRELTGVKLESQIISNEDSIEALEEYETTKNNPTDSLGIYTGIDAIDDACKGLKNHELMLVAAYTGHCKTTFCLNMAYRAVFSGWNTAFVSLEMSFTEIRRMIYVLHSCNPMFKEKYPKYAHLVGQLTYNGVAYGTLNKEEEEFYKLVVQDILENEDYGKFYVWQPEKSVTTVADIDMKFRSIQHEFKSKGRDLEFGIIDYVSLMGADDRDRTKDFNQTLNNIIKSIKRMCLTFNNGKGIRIVSPFQTNREGYKDAKAHDGIYSSTALSNAHEAERSSDVIMSIFISETDRNSGMLTMCNLKNRRNKFFPPFKACINFESKYIYNFTGNSDVDPLEDMELIVGKG